MKLGDKKAIINCIPSKDSMFLHKIEGKEHQLLKSFGITIRIYNFETLLNASIKIDIARHCKCCENSMFVNADLLMNAMCQLIFLNQPEFPMCQTYQNAN